MSDFPIPLPPDLDRLQAIRRWIVGQQETLPDGGGTIATLLEVLAGTVDAAIAATAPASGPEEYRIQRMRVPYGRSVLHRPGCWVDGGAVISREEALLALSDEVVRGQLEMCDVCSPGKALGA